MDVTAKPKPSSKGNKKKSAKKSKVSSKKAATHPTVAKMVTDAIHTLNQKKGTSVVAIKKYLSETYKVDTEKLAPFIKKYLAKSVLNNTFIQVTGKGYAGSFKLVNDSAKKKKSSKPHVTASGAINEEVKVSKKLKATPTVRKKSKSENQPRSRRSTRRSVDKSSPASTDED